MHAPAARETPAEFDPTDWRQALDRWQEEEQSRRKAEAGQEARNGTVGRIPVGWWLEAFANPPTPSEAAGHACGEHEMLVVVAYDIRDHKRLARVARHCEDHGARIQYSVFECRMPGDRFELFWLELQDLIDSENDRLIAYRVCASCAGEVLSAGTQEMTVADVVAYVF